MYVLYAGIVGKGRLYSVDNIKEGKEEEFKAFSRKIYILLGIAMVINSGASILRNQFYAYQEITPATDAAKAVYGWVNLKDLGAFSFLTPKVFDIVSYVALAATLGLIVFLVVKMRKYMDKNAQAKKAAAAKPAGGSSMPSSAFHFDDEDKNAQ
ncbi:hypothetical protein SDC9_114107 [bioreactor metagenome]|uniref:Uncharacterized protein n=1 Tax=bioreactor metagenome TaxID=1076179 RepID=A0A645BNX7_9ZZZZ